MITVALDKPVRVGSEIRVETVGEPMFLTDNMGNTYVKVKRFEWRARVTNGGFLRVSSNVEMKVEEWR